MQIRHLLTNKSHPCLLVNQCLLARGLRPRYAGASVCNTPMVWSPCGQMPWVWGHTKGFHWRNGKAPESCGSGQADISTTTFPMEFSSGDVYICSANVSNSFTSCCWKQKRVPSPKVHRGGKQVPRGQKSRDACSLQSNVGVRPTCFTLWPSSDVITKCRKTTFQWG